MKFRRSLLAKYLLIILVALTLIPMSFPIISLFLLIPGVGTDENQGIYNNGTDLEKMWHQEAKDLQGASDDTVSQKLRELHEKYKESNIFWVDEEGTTRLKIPENITIPQQWSASYTVDFMKNNRGYEVDPYTVVAHIGEHPAKGFIVLQVPRTLMKGIGESMIDKYGYAITIGVVIVLAFFIFISWLFFYRIRKRLIHLRKAMTIPADKEIPLPISVGKNDEIGELEESFNEMLTQLEASNKREKEEEDLRRRLIANLSHDLRTPLTTIRGHAFSLKKEPLSDKGQESLVLIDKKIDYLGQLIENLLSYTLLSAHKYPFDPKKTDIVRLLRTSFASWYPVFENLGFEIELQLPEKAINWLIDTQWMNRILDNFFQNIVRHAREGKYIALQLNEEGKTLTITDKGPGMEAASTEKGAGIGITIAALMLKEMQLEWEIDTGDTGTVIQVRNENV
ncbi:HAMP domain-containing histidine kinase [Bacillaceae bacterium Marseille-Q3522]|nr:HAMP domain-containing histidine kinase [Bacillaceae bacterium Marseille-Q3522]